MVAQQDETLDKIGKNVWRFLYFSDTYLRSKKLFWLQPKKIFWLLEVSIFLEQIYILVTYKL